MEWLTCIRNTIDYIERHLGENISAQDVAGQVNISPFFLQKGFSLMTGYGIAEYIRNRRLYQAALDLKKTDSKVIDIALRYGYETPESFSKAFQRFHGATPLQVRDGAEIQDFLPLKINISVFGGHHMINCKITPMFPFRVIGFQRIFNNETAYAEIPKFWDELCEKYADHVYAGNPPANPYEKAIVDNCIGEYGICVRIAVAVLGLVLVGEVHHREHVGRVAERFGNLVAKISPCVRVADQCEWVAQIQWRTMCVGKPNILDREEMERVMVKFQSHGQVKAKK